MSTSARNSDPRRYVQISNVLRGQIDNGTYKPGEVLPSLGRLAASFAVHRKTAQHAMWVLASEGLVALAPGYGYYVLESS
jgi:DNA-binding GntR family transcriptional regulator